MKNNVLMIAVVTAVVAGALGFFGGMKYQQQKFSSFGGRLGMMGGQGGSFGAGQGRGGQRGMGFRPVLGDIISSDDKSITVKLQDGSSKIIFLSEKTMINKASNATKTDLSNGERVAVFGETNPDGSVTAQSIQLNPTMMGMRGGINATPSASPLPNQ